MDAGVFVPAGSDMIEPPLHGDWTGDDRSEPDWLHGSEAPPRKVSAGRRGRRQSASCAKQANATLAIPPYASNHPGPLAEIAFLKRSSSSGSGLTHMCGDRPFGTLVHPDGQEETVLYVREYNFNWQLTYRTSVKIPQGAKCASSSCDNSTANKYNLTRASGCKHGGQSWEEWGLRTWASWSIATPTSTTC